MPKRLILLMIMVSVCLLGGMPSIPGVVAGAQEESATMEEEEEFVYDDHEGRDPFWPLVTPSGAIITHEKDLTIADLVLEGIMTEGDANNTAIINGRILVPEDAIGSFVIKSVAADYVVLQKGKQIFTLKLKKED